MVLIGVVGLPCAGKSEFMSFLHTFYDVKPHPLPLPSTLQSHFHSLSKEKNENFEEDKEEIKENNIKQENNGVHNQVKKETFEEIIEKWNENIVIGPIYSIELINHLRRKPYFHLVFIESSVLQRFANFKKKYHSGVEIMQFLKMEAHITQEFRLEEIRKLSKFDLANNSSLSEFFASIKANIRFILRPIKPTWEQYFMSIAFSVRSRSNCMRKK